MSSSVLSLSVVALALLLSGTSVDAFSTTTTSSSSSRSPHHAVHQLSTSASAAMPMHRRRRQHSTSTTILFESEDSDAAAIAEMTELQAAQTRETPTLTPSDRTFVASLVAACQSNTELMENELAANIGNMSPGLVVALQIAAEKEEWADENENDIDDDDDEDFATQMVALGLALQNVLDVRLKDGREMLKDLLDSGELRKLDGMIGKAAKEGKLDMSFFSVLSMNMKDAAANDAEGAAAAATPTLSQGEGQEEVRGDEGRPATGANRIQILQHIYTRCQEELEKNVAPGVGLLNKLLRTEISSIRSNQLSYYLAPQQTSITSPEGDVIELPGTSKPMVGHGEFTDALQNAVTQIRTLEAAGGTDRLSAMNLVESIRQVAMEARGVLVESYGEGSVEVEEFQRDLQPVFRPPASN